MFKKLIITLLSSVMMTQGINLSLVKANEFEFSEEEITEKEDKESLKINENSFESSESTITMYRLYNSNSGEHFYTGDSIEKQFLIKAGWKDEGAEWIAPSYSIIPVYRLYNSNSGDHHYTVDKNEYTTLMSIGWKGEGIRWYSDENQAIPLYRLYNPNAKEAGSHHYTADAQEKASLKKLGWQDEGIAWYGSKAQSSQKLNLAGEYFRSSLGGANWVDEWTIDKNNHIRATYYDINFDYIEYFGYSGDLTNIKFKSKNKYSATITNTKNEIPLLPMDINYFKTCVDLKSKNFYDGDSVTIYLPGYSTENLGSDEKALKDFITYKTENFPVLKEIFIVNDRYSGGYFPTSSNNVPSKSQIIKELTSTKNNGMWGYMGPIDPYLENNLFIESMTFTHTNVSLSIAGFGSKNSSLELGPYSYDVVPEAEEKNASIFLLTIYDVNYENKVGNLVFQVGLYRGEDLDPNQLIGYSSANFVTLRNEIFTNSPRIQKFNLVS